MPTTLLVVGDVAGHLTALDEVLAPFDVCVSESEVPAGTVVVQVGDLVGRSGESARLIACVDRLRDRAPDRWVQLAGNHELHHLGGHQFQGTCELPDDAVSTMRAWLDEGSMRVAIVLHAGDSAVLVSHAGLTRGLWTELGAPLNADDAAAALESLQVEPGGWDAINRPGRMLNLGRFPITESAAGPIWAEASVELLPPLKRPSTPPPSPTTRRPTGASPSSPTRSCLRPSCSGCTRPSPTSSAATPPSRA